MDLNIGTILISTEKLADTNFEKTVIIISEHNEKGSLGFVINKLFPRRFNELAEFKNSMAFPLYNGGPVETESLYFIHCRPDLIDGGNPITDNIFMGGDFKKAVMMMDQKMITDKELKLFVGYCGWDDNELNQEIEEGSWQIIEMPTQNIFNLLEDLWQKLTANT
ncbi:MAG: YqgE/AlgH family protein [Bacteroidota bacterium]